MDLAELRAAFPALGPDGLCFLDWGATGLLPEPTRRALHAFADDLASCPERDATWVHGTHGRTRQAVRNGVAALIGADAADIALVESTTAGLGVAAATLQPEPGQNVVVSEIDYLAVPHPWKLLAAEMDLELRWVPARDGGVALEDVLALVDDRTHLVSLSTVCWTTGALLDLERLAPALRERGVDLVLDGIQTFGVIPVDVTRTPVSFLAVGGHKWLASVLGSGFLYIDPQVCVRHPPRNPGFLAGHPVRGQWWEWFQNPDSGPREDVVLPSRGRTYEVGGTPSYPGAIGLDCALNLFSDVGIERIQEHVRDLGDRLMAGLDALQFQVLTPRARSKRAGIVVFRVPGGADAQREAVATLRSRDVLASVRYAGGFGGIRVSLHGPNDASDVDRVLAALR